MLDSATLESTVPVNLDSTAVPVTQAAATAEPDQVWIDQPFGGGSDRLAVYFYTGQGGARCIRYLVSTPGAKVVSACAGQTAQTDTMILVSGVEPARDGQVFTIIAGRVFDDKTTVVSFQMENDETLPVSVDNGGIILILPGRRAPVQAVPIDQFGNLTGALYKFGK